MDRTRRTVISLYVATYGLAVWAGATALEDGNALAATSLFTAAVALLVGIFRECRHAARLIRIVSVYRHHQMPDPYDAQSAELEAATAIPPGCSCETWWTSLGDHHAPQCPAHPKATW